MTPAVRRRVRVRGRVQGVWFRESTRQEATRVGAIGWVCNLPDGSVEAAFEGTPEAVEALVAFCRRGPPAARVDAVEVVEEPARGGQGFRVTRQPPQGEEAPQG